MHGVRCGDSGPESNERMIESDVHELIGVRGVPGVPGACVHHGEFMAKHIRNGRVCLVGLMCSTRPNRVQPHVGPTMKRSIIEVLFIDAFLLYSTYVI